MTRGVALAMNARRRGVRTSMIWGSSLLGNEVGPMIYRDFLPAALAEGSVVQALAARIVSRGLDQIPDALEQQRRGVSAAKPVVTL